LTTLAFHCNQFIGREPDKEAKIKQFAESLRVKFKTFSKIDVLASPANSIFFTLIIKVNGPKAYPLWTYLQEQAVSK
jgi:glutathione peroxidase-family protein